MIIHDPKKAAVMIIAHSEPQKESEDVQEREFVNLADDILHAIKSGDAEGLAIALKAFHMECDEEYGEEEHEEPESYE